jgi:hypothetical protein
MLDALRGKASDRKLRLFAVACCRRIWHLLIDTASRRAVEAAELFADEQISKEELQSAFVTGTSAMLAERGNLAYTSSGGGIGGPVTAAYITAFVGVDGYGAADGVASCAIRAATGNRGDEWTERAKQAGILRDLFGPLHFRPVSLDPAWRTPAILHLAQAIYDDRAFDQFPILADALEEAGCTSRDVLDHCRGPGPHVRGCWVVDLVLGKG